MTFAELALLLTALGVGYILRDLLNRLLDRRKGKLKEEQSAWERADSEARHRRELEESVHQHRQLWNILDNRPYDEMPPVPEAPKK